MSAIIEQAKQLIKHTHYQRIGNTTTTVCALEMACGFVVVGKSSAIDTASFDEAAGQQYAYEDALNQLVEHLAFFMRFTDTLKDTVVVILNENPEFLKMNSEQQAYAIRAFLTAAATPQHDDDRGYFLNAANVLLAHTESDEQPET